MTTVLPDIGLAPEEYFRVPGTDDNGHACAVSNAVDSFVAPSIMKGRSRYDSMLKRDSATLSWKIALKTDRRAKLVYEERLPAGFPLLHEFFTKSKSMRVFEIGLDTYMALYPEPTHWARWHATVENIGQWSVQALRNVMLTTFDPDLNEGKKPSRLQLNILRLTVEKGFWPERMALPLKGKARREMLWARLRRACRACKYVRVWKEHHEEVQKNRLREVERSYVTMSPSLKRKWEV
jgi:hypothetical protein